MKLLHGYLLIFLFNYCLSTEKNIQDDQKQDSIYTGLANLRIHFSHITALRTFTINVQKDHDEYHLLNLKIIFPLEFIVQGEVLLKDESDQATQLQLLTGEDGEKYYEFNEKHYNKLNEFISRLYYRNTTKVDANKKYKIKYVVSDQKNQANVVKECNVELTINISSEYLLTNVMVPLWREKHFDLTLIRIMENKSFTGSLQLHSMGMSYPDWVNLYYDKNLGSVKVSGKPPNEDNIDFNLQFYMYDNLSQDASDPYQLFFRNNRTEYDADTSIYSLIIQLLCMFLLIIIVLCILLAKKVRRDNEKKEVDNIIHNNNVMRDEEEKKEDINVLTKSILEWNKESEDLKNNKDSVAGLGIFFN